MSDYNVGWMFRFLDLETTRFMRQQLGLLLYGLICDICDVQTNNQMQLCNIPCCEIKNVYKHMIKCQAYYNCTFTNCVMFRQLISHWILCQSYLSQNCLLCNSIIKAKKSRAHFVQALLEQFVGDTRQKVVFPNISNSSNSKITPTPVQIELWFKQIIPHENFLYYIFMTAMFPSGNYFSGKVFPEKLWDFTEKIRKLLRELKEETKSPLEYHFIMAMTIKKFYKLKKPHLLKDSESGNQLRSDQRERSGPEETFQRFWTKAMRTSHYNWRNRFNRNRSYRYRIYTYIRRSFVEPASTGNKICNDYSEAQCQMPNAVSLANCDSYSEAQCQTPNAVSLANCLEAATADLNLLKIEDYKNIVFEAIKDFNLLKIENDSESSVFDEATKKSSHLRNHLTNYHPHLSNVDDN